MAAAPKSDEGKDLLNRLESGLGKDKPIKVWLDSDCACFTSKSTLLAATNSMHPNDPDDGWALCAILNSDRCDLVGVSSTYGNDTEKIARDDLATALSKHHKGKDIKVSAGAVCPLQPLAGIGAYNDNASLATRTNDAVKAMQKTLKGLDDGEKLVIYADGPGTNVATLLLLHPELKDKIDFVLLFMARDTVDNPVLAVGSVAQALRLYFTDFNFELDRYAVEILIKSGVSLVFAGAEVALNSMWLWKDDLEAIAKRVADNKNNQLITELSKEENYKTWLGVFQTMGTHLAPWNKDNNHTTNLNTINGFIPFGVISGSVLCASELYNYKNVNPSLPIAKSTAFVTVKKPVDDSATSGDDNDDATTSTAAATATATASASANGAAANNAATGVISDAQPAVQANDEVKQTSNDGDNGDEKYNDDISAVMKTLSPQEQEMARKLLASADHGGRLGLFRNAGRSLGNISSQHAQQTNLSLEQYRMFLNTKSNFDYNFGGMKDWNLNIGGDVKEEVDVEKVKKKTLPKLTPTFFIYCLCTNDDPVGKADNVFAEVPGIRDNIFYVPSVKGDYPWNNYKDAIIKLLEKD